MKTKVMKNTFDLEITGCAGFQRFQINKESTIHWTSKMSQMIHLVAVSPNCSSTHFPNFQRSCLNFCLSCSWLSPAFFTTRSSRQIWKKNDFLECVEAAYTFLTYLVFTFYCRTLVLMSMPTVLQPLCGSCWLVVQSHRDFITNQSLFALPNKQRYCSYHQAMCLHLLTQVTLSCFVCTLLMFFICIFKTF